MSSTYRPDGYSAVSPYLIVDGAARTIEFLIRVFGAQELRRFPAEDGRIIHAELRIEDTVLMVADSAQGWPPVPSHVHVYVPDVDATFRAALDAGGEAVQEPEKKNDEDRRGGVMDPGGTTWWIATRVG
jgi:PhnB protein